jgi:signal peptidase I
VSASGGLSPDDAQPEDVPSGSAPPETLDSAAGAPVPEPILGSAGSDCPVGKGVPGAAGTPLGAPKRRRRHRGLIEWALIVVIAVVAAVVLRSYVIEPFSIPSGSMLPTIHIGDRVLVNKLSYDLHPVHRGDVIVFHKPPDAYLPGINVLIKRVVGLPGDTVSARGGEVYIDGRPLAEPWLPKDDPTANFGPYHDGADCYFVMGDNRDNSDDSRVFGCISGHLIIGRAFFIAWPPSQIGGL